MENQCCPCGGIILADTEDWVIPVCYDCFIILGSIDIDPPIEVDIKWPCDNAYTKMSNHVKVKFTREFPGPKITD